MLRGEDGWLSYLLCAALRYIENEEKRREGRERGREVRRREEKGEGGSKEKASERSGSRRPVPYRIQVRNQGSVTFGCCFVSVLLVMVNVERGRDRW